VEYRFHSVSSVAWDAMLAAIKSAKNSIYWESYIFDNDTEEHNFFAVLEEKAKQGVRVKMIADSLGSFQLGRSVVGRLQAAGAEVLFYNRLLPWWNPQRFKFRWFHRNHKKLLIVDEQRAFVGGVNVGRRFKNWLDLQVELRGMIVRYLIRSFIVSYELSGGRDKIKYRGIFQGRKVKAFHHSPLTERSVLRKYYRRSCSMAQKNIIIATPYFFPQPWLVDNLRKARRRGVKIEIILPRKADHWISTMANYAAASLLARPGIDFYFSRAMVHAKALLVDGREGIIGSQNIDALSFDYNLEAGIVFQRKDMVRSLKKILEGWLADSDKFVFDPRRQNWWQRLKTAVYLALRPHL